MIRLLILTNDFMGNMDTGVLFAFPDIPVSLRAPESAPDRLTEPDEPVNSRPCTICA